MRIFHNGPPICAHSRARYRRVTGNPQQEYVSRATETAIVDTKIRQIDHEGLTQYASISVSMRIESVLRVDVIDRGLGGFRLVEESVEPYEKDFDAITPGDDPTAWPRRFDISNWAIFLVEKGGEAVAGATVAFDTPGVNMLEGRTDLAVLWDLRVHPGFRRRGLGTMLFERAADWARRKGCKQLKIESQNVNVPACRFYAKQGSVLGAIDRHGYSGCPAVAHEAMLLWYLDL